MGFWVLLVFLVFVLETAGVFAGVTLPAGRAGSVVWERRGGHVVFLMEPQWAQSSQRREEVAEFG